MMDVVYAHSGSDLFRVDPRPWTSAASAPSPSRPMRRRPLPEQRHRHRRRPRPAGSSASPTTSCWTIDPATGDCSRAGPAAHGRSLQRPVLDPRRAGPGTAGGHQLRRRRVPDRSRHRRRHPDRHAGRGPAVQRRSGVGGQPRHPADREGHGPRANDRLARIDPATGAATVIGPTGFRKIWGLGFWGNKVFGFTQTGQFILIDPRTGAGTLVKNFPAFPFWGAGVTTAVTVID